MDMGILKKDLIHLYNTTDVEPISTIVEDMDDLGGKNYNHLVEQLVADSLYNDIVYKVVE